MTLPKGKIGRNGRWHRVEQARAKLDASADQIMSSMIKAAVAGDVKAGRWLLEHIAVERDGVEVRPLATGIDRPAAPSLATADTAPRIIIGVSLGRDFAQLATHSSAPPPLPAIDVSPLPLPASLPRKTRTKPSK